MYDDLDKFEPVAKIVVIGVGGAGNNAVNRMIEDNINSVEFYVANTDKQTLALSKAPNKIILGENLTGGLGAGGLPEIGKKAANESKEEIKKILEGKDMLFIAAGMGGGTGTGAAPVIAQIAKELGLLTVAVVTRPFSFEGNTKIEYSIFGINELSKVVDSIIIESNDKLLLIGGNMTVSKAFEESDAVLARCVKTVTDMILTPFLMNIDFADVKNVLKESGIALIGYGTGSGEGKCKEAVENAINSPLLETGINGARRAICAITFGPQIIMNEINEVINLLKKYSDQELNMKFALSKNPALGDDIIVSIIASDYENAHEILNQNSKSFDFSSIKENKSEDNSSVEEEESNEVSTEDILPNFLEDDEDENKPY
ncbi:MAG: cell division protein FtsZ [Bacilli bacterium]